MGSYGVDYKLTQQWPTRATTCDTRCNMRAGARIKTYKPRHTGDDKCFKRMRTVSRLPPDIKNKHLGLPVPKSTHALTRLILQVMHRLNTKKKNTSEFYTFSWFMDPSQRVQSSKTSTLTTESWTTSAAHAKASD